MAENEKTSKSVAISTSELNDISLKIMSLYLKEQEINELIRHSTQLDFDTFNEVKLRYKQFIEPFFSINLNKYSNNANYDHLEFYIKAIVEHIEKTYKEDKNQISNFMLKLNDYFEDLVYLIHSYKCLA